MKSALALVFSRFALVALFFAFPLFTLTLALPRQAHAQACDAPAGSSQEAIDQLNKCAIEKDIFDDKIFNLNQISGTTDSLYNLLTGRSQLHPETNQITQNGGALAASGKMVALLYSSPPVSGVQYFAGEFQKFNPVQPAYAQEGIGFGALRPIQDIWRVFRNAAYVGFVIVFVIIGFMIMLRAHISPQAVATIQDSIPRLVVALILVTFSYAIAGLMIDLMFLILNLVINFLKASGLLGDANYVFEKNVFSVVFGSLKDIIGSVANAIEGLIKGIVDLGFLEDLIGFFGGTIAGIIAAIAMLFIMFRVFLMLLMAYVMIIILTMTAPFFFLVQALPGNNGAKEWFKQMAANVSVFAVVAIMFIFGGILGGIESLGGLPKPVIGEGDVGQFPLFAGGIDVKVIGNLIGFGFLLMTPQAGDMVKKFISGGQGGGGGFAPGAAVGAALGAGAGVVGSGARGAWSQTAPWNPIVQRGAAAKERAQVAAQRKYHTGIYSPEYSKQMKEIYTTPPPPKNPPEKP